MKKDNFYYLFKTERNAQEKLYYTHVFRSRNPYYFGIGDARPYYVCTLKNVAAIEIVTDDQGKEYTSSIHDHSNSIRLARLKWKEDLQPQSETDYIEIGSFIGVPNYENPHGGTQTKSNPATAGPSRSGRPAETN